MDVLFLNPRTRQVSQTKADFRGKDRFVQAVKAGSSRKKITARRLLESATESPWETAPAPGPPAAAPATPTRARPPRRAPAPASAPDTTWPAAAFLPTGASSASAAPRPRGSVALQARGTPR